MQIIVKGDRAWSCPELAKAIISRLLARYGPDLVIVNSAATGVDRSFTEAAAELGVEREPHPAHWAELNAPRSIIRHDKNGMPYNANAGPLRNLRMVASGADLCLALHRSLASSKGTKDCVRQAIKARISTWLIDSDEANPLRLLGDDQTNLGSSPSRRTTNWMKNHPSLRGNQAIS